MNGIISPNMLKTYELCPKKFYFRFVKNISMPIDDTIFETGKNIHALASYYLRKENIDNMEKSLSMRESELWNYLKNTKFFGYECINTEYNLAVKIGKHFFGGRLDALVKDKNGKYYILDYKTGSAPKNAVYDYQTIVYILAVRKFYETNNIAFVYLDLSQKNDVVIELTENLVVEYEKKLLATENCIDSEDYNPKWGKCPCECNNKRNCEYDVICY